MFEQYTKDLASLLVPEEEFHPFPGHEDREGWLQMNEEYREFLIRKGEEYLGYDWPSVPASVYMDFYRNGNRTRYQKIIFSGRRLPLEYLTAAECCEGKGRFLDDIINGIWATCDEATWVIPAHNVYSPEGDIIRPLPETEDPELTYVDLFSAECGAVIAWVYYMLEKPLNAISTQVTARIRGTLKRRIFEPFMKHDDFWWMGFKGQVVNNWNPWILSNVMTAAVLASPGEEMRAAILEKSLRSLENFMKIYTPDGGCDEGPGYWDAAGASMFDCLEIIKDATDGRVDFLKEEIVRNICSYIYKMHIEGSYYVNYADARGKLTPNEFIIYRMGLETGDPDMVKMGIHLYNEKKKQGVSWNMDGCGCMIYREMKKFFIERRLADEEDPGYPLVRDVWFPGIQVMAARKQNGSSEGLYLSAKGGTNAESHNHNDIGSFVLYCDGKPMLVDIGTAVYEKKTFSAQRYEIMQMQSNYHNLPIIGGFGQLPGEQYKATDVKYCSDEAKVHFQLNMEKAYPKEAGIAAWNREFAYDRNADKVNIVDNFTLNQPQTIEWVFMTATEPVIAEGSLQITNGTAEVHLDYDPALQATVEPWDTHGDANLTPVWGERLYRTVLKLPEKASAGEYTWTIRKI